MCEETYEPENGKGRRSPVVLYGSTLAAGNGPGLFIDRHVVKRLGRAELRHGKEREPVALVMTPSLP